MAGGFGNHFWPLSRSAKPKQFLDILGTGRTCIQQTYDRFAAFIPKENIFVVTNIRYKKLIKEQLPEIHESRLLLEPLKRNTAPCLAYAANKIATITHDAQIVVTPSDHLVLKEIEFQKQLKNGLELVQKKDVLLTLGVKPNRPETDYGYIQVKQKKEFKDIDNLYKVKTFTEKPDKEMAQIFVNSGEFYWNSGIFISSLSTILNAFQEHLSEIALKFEQGRKLMNTSNEEAFVNKTYSECPAISIDYGIMEKAKNVYVLTADFGWSDLGTWNSLYENKEKDTAGNVYSGDNIFVYDSTNCIVDVPKDRVAVIHGLDGYVIAGSSDTIMICKREDEEQIKQFVTDVRIKKGDSLV
jgi:mannose-1-phosphate guanylyltransferase